MVHKLAKLVFVLLILGAAGSCSNSTRPQPAATEDGSNFVPGEVMVQFIQSISEDEALAIARRLTSADEAEFDLADDDHASRTELTMKIKASTRLGVDALPEADERAPRNAREQTCHEQLAALPLGSLIEVTTDAGEL